jgi:hypothetical protein
MEGDVMKAITLWQPWASLWAAGIKKNETRSWATSHRGPLAIHAAKLTGLQLYRRIGTEAMLDLERIIADNIPQFRLGGWRLFESPNVDNLPRGCIVGTVDVVDCWLIGPTSFDERATILTDVEHGLYDYVPEKEEPLGNYSPGRYAWIGKGHNTILPVPWAGHQGLWDVPEADLLYELSEATS